MATLDIFQLVFQDILKISSTILYRYATFQDQIFYLIFLPHVVLFLFLFGFGRILAPETGSKGLRYLVMATAYIFIVYQGWYGQILIPLFQTWFTIMLGFSLAIFLISRIIHPYTAKEISKHVGGAVGKEVGKHLGKGKELQALQDELDGTIKQMSKTKERMNDPQFRHPYTRAALEQELKMLDDKKRALERAIHKY